MSTEDPITRILARFRAPTPESVDTIVSFSKRFADRIDEPMQAYKAKRGVLPPAASRGVLSLMRLWREARSSPRRRRSLCPTRRR